MVTWRCLRLGQPVHPSFSEAETLLLDAEAVVFCVFQYSACPIAIFFHHFLKTANSKLQYSYVNGVEAPRDLVLPPNKPSDHITVKIVVNTASSNQIIVFPCQIVQEDLTRVGATSQQRWLYWVETQTVYASLHLIKCTGVSITWGLFSLNYLLKMLQVQISPRWLHEPWCVN